MSRLRLFFFTVVCACALTAVLFACVGDDPASAPAPDGGGTPPPPPLPPNPPPNAPPPGGGDAAEDAGQHFCATRSTPPGATDYFCADFDEDTDASDGWTKTTLSSEGGVMQTTTLVASSLPNSLIVTPGAGDPVSPFAGVELEKDFAGAKNITQVVLRADVNYSKLDVGPDSSGHVQLLTVSSTDIVVSLNHTRGPATLGPPSSKSNYVGYFVTGVLFGSAIVTYDAPMLLSALPNGQWRTVELTYVATSGLATISVNGVTLFSQSINMSTNSAGSGAIGAVPSGQVRGPDSWRFDNVELSVFRAP